MDRIITCKVRIEGSDIRFKTLSDSTRYSAIISNSKHHLSRPLNPQEER